MFSGQKFQLKRTVERSVIVHKVPPRFEGQRVERVKKAITILLEQSAIYRKMQIVTVFLRHALQWKCLHLV